MMPYLEVMWVLGWLVPDDKVIADFRKDNGAAIRKVCARFVELCRKTGLLPNAKRRYRRQQIQARLFRVLWPVSEVAATPINARRQSEIRPR
jgi:hypothetical protein